MYIFIPLMNQTLAVWFIYYITYSVELPLLLKEQACFLLKPSQCP